MPSRIADPTLAPEGERRIRWVARNSPVLTRLARDELEALGLAIDELTAAQRAFLGGWEAFA